MLQIQTLLVAYDFSHSSKLALKQAIQMALPLQARLLIAHVLEESPESEVLELFKLPANLVEALTEKIRQDLQTLFPEYASQNLSFEILVTRGRPAAEILDLAKQERADWIVVGTHRKSVLKRLWIGSVAEKIVQHSPVPVWVVRKENESVRKVLVGIDFAENSQDLIAVASASAKQLRATLHLAHVVNLKDLYLLDLFSLAPDRAGVEETLFAQATQKLEKLSSSLGFPCSIEVRLGDPADQMMALIEEQAIDCTVVATHGRSGVGHFLLGSVAQKLVREAQSSVLVLPLPQQG